ncbi:MAG: aminotransferase class I/II-fold pyridoxal phosphate-dependent enzyme [Acidobacteriota bacterium]|nr:aminotransferase class I/II-fold pyridoxal phosphate-dependent enzyme [Acidobacteriota bacterium]
MSANLKSACEKFVPGHLPQKAGEEFALIADYCRENDFAADVYGNGDLINSFEKKVAGLLGFEAACFMPSGTTAQQIALKIYAGKSENQSFAIHPTSHLELHEQHAYAHLCNLKSIIIGDKNRQLNAQDITNLNESVSTVIIELPAREIGGQLPNWEELEAIKKTTKKRGVFLHIDGARLWETKSFYQKSYEEICRNFDSVYVSFYKGVGALTGAMLLGNVEFIDQSRVWLRRFGGNLFQLHPYVASTAMRFDDALVQMPEYMRRTEEVYEALKNIEGIAFCPNPPQVNMFHLYFNSSADKMSAARDEIAWTDKIWTANRFQTTALENLCYTEIYVGEGLLQIKDGELTNVFTKLIEMSV